MGYALIRVWLVCRPNARAAVNAALGAADASWAGTMAAPFPRQGAPRLYVAGWQDTVANLTAARAALAGIPGWRMLRGATWGEESDDSAEADPTRGDPLTTKYTRRAAMRAAIAAMGLTVPDEDIP